jgi:hypothetical protein
MHAKKHMHAITCSSCVHEATVRISWPSGVMRMVCSHCAAKPPSIVVAVQSSFHILTLLLPSTNIGSMVNVWLTCSRAANQARMHAMLVCM